MSALGREAGLTPSQRQKSVERVANEKMGSGPTRWLNPGYSSFLLSVGPPSILAGIPYLDETRLQGETSPGEEINGLEPQIARGRAAVGRPPDRRRSGERRAAQVQHGCARRAWGRECDDRFGRGRPGERRQSGILRCAWDGADDGLRCPGRLRPVRAQAAEPVERQVPVLRRRR